MCDVLCAGVGAVGPQSCVMVRVGTIRSTSSDITTDDEHKLVSADKIGGFDESMVFKMGKRTVF